MVLVSKPQLFTLYGEAVDGMATLHGGGQLWEGLVLQVFRDLRRAALVDVAAAQVAVVLNAGPKGSLYF